MRPFTLALVLAIATHATVGAIPTPAPVPPLAPCATYVAVADGPGGADALEATFARLGPYGSSLRTFWGSDAPERARAYLTADPLACRWNQPTSK